MEVSETIFDLNVGETFYYRNYKYHVVSIINEKPYPQIVYKYYGKYKQWWHYEIESIFSFNDKLHVGIFSVKKK